jgi:small subunit ribosomal protein S6
MLRNSQLKRNTSRTQSRLLEEWGNRRMAYAIQKDREGYYLIFKLEMPTDQTNIIQTSLRLRDHVRRVLVVKHRPEWSTKKKPKAA